MRQYSTYRCTHARRFLGSYCQCQECYTRRLWVEEYNPGETAGIRDLYRRQYDPNHNPLPVWRMSQEELQWTLTRIQSQVLDSIYHRSLGAY